MRCCCRYFTTSVKYVWIGLTLERDLNISIQCRQNVEELLFIWNWVSCLKYPAHIVFHCSRGKGWGVARKYLERMCIDISWREARWRRRRDQRLKLDQEVWCCSSEVWSLDTAESGNSYLDQSSHHHPAKHSTLSFSKSGNIFIIWQHPER